MFETCEPTTLPLRLCAETRTHSAQANMLKTMCPVLHWWNVYGQIRSCLALHQLCLSVTACVNSHRFHAFKLSIDRRHILPISWNIAMSDTGDLKENAETFVGRVSLS
jgi:hypothetical protein